MILILTNAGNYRLNSSYYLMKRISFLFNSRKKRSEIVLTPVASLWGLTASNAKNGQID